jgi:hypothetical protein
MKGLTLKDLVPTTGLFPAYIRAASSLTDAPALYHVAAFLAILSSVVCPHAQGLVVQGRKHRREPLFLWLMLMGQSGNRKSEAAKKAVELAADPRLIGTRIRSAAGSRQGIEEMLQAERHPFVFIQEAALWFRSNRAAYMHDGAAMWCEVYDGMMLGRNLASNSSNPEEDKKNVVRVSLLACGATPAVMRATKPDDWSGGLLARVMILGTPMGQERPGPFSWPDSVAQKLRDHICGLVELAQSTHYVRVLPEASTRWDAWLLRLSGRARGLSEVHAVLCRRLPAHVLRIACLYALSRRSLTVSADDMIRAMALGDVSYDSLLAIDLR